MSFDHNIQFAWYLEINTFCTYIYLEFTLSIDIKSHDIVRLEANTIKSIKKN